MDVTIKFSDTITKTVDIDFAWQLFYLYQQGAKKAGEKITQERLVKWAQVEDQLQVATDGSNIDFTLLGDIYYTNGGPQLSDDID